MTDQTKNYEEMSDKAMDELFEFIGNWAEKYENEGLEFQGLVNFVAFDPEGECVGGQYNTNITSLETFDIINEDLIASIAKREEELQNEEDEEDGEEIL